MSHAETKAHNLHAALTKLLGYYEDLIRGTSSEPTFGEDEGVVMARKALFENRPLADWEPDPVAAAAPDMLLALAWLVGINDEKPRDADEQRPLALAAARAALAKATGARP